MANFEEIKQDSLRTRLNKAKVLKHLKLVFGNVRLACRNANVSASQFYKWRQTDASFLEKELNIHKGIETFAVVKALKKLEEENLIELQKLRRKSVKRTMSSN